MESSDQREAVRRAVVAAHGRDAAGFFTELAAAHVLDGVTRQLEGQWSTADREALYDAVSYGADRLYETAVEGGSPRNSIAFLFSVARNRMRKLHHERRRETEVPETLLDPRPLPGAPGAEGDEAGDRSLDEALRIARSLLPRLGQEGIQKVMAVVFDAIERGDEYVENETIAEITGLSIETVRRSKNRGWDRLEREAKKAGLVLPEAMRSDEDGGTEEREME